MHSIHNHLPSPMSFASTPNNNFSFQEEQEEDECIPTQMKTFSVNLFFFLTNSSTHNLFQ